MDHPSCQQEMNNSDFRVKVEVEGVTTDFKESAEVVKELRYGQHRSRTHDAVKLL